MPDHDAYECFDLDHPFYEWCPSCRAAWSRLHAVALSLPPDFDLLDTPIGLANEEDGPQSVEFTDEQIDEAAWHAAVEAMRSEHDE